MEKQQKTVEEYKSNRVPRIKRIIFWILMGIFILLAVIIILKMISFDSVTKKYQNKVLKYARDWRFLQYSKESKKQDESKIKRYNLTLLSDLYDLSENYENIKDYELVTSYIIGHIESNMLFDAIEYNNSIKTAQTPDLNQELINLIKYYGYSVSDLTLVHEAGEVYCTGVFQNTKDDTLEVPLEMTLYYFDQDGNIVDKYTYDFMIQRSEALEPGDTKNFKFKVNTPYLSQIAYCDIGIVKRVLDFKK